MGGAITVAGALRFDVTTLLFGTRATDPVTFAATVAVLGAVGAVASYLPARRASRIAPIEALRCQ
jgi:ABC-type antimicrobial peptide transport system permease subunit